MSEAILQVILSLLWAVFLAESGVFDALGQQIAAEVGQLAVVLMGLFAAALVVVSFLLLRPSGHRGRMANSAQQPTRPEARG